MKRLSLLLLICTLLPPLSASWAPEVTVSLGPDLTFYSNATWTSLSAKAEVSLLSFETGPWRASLPLEGEFLTPSQTWHARRIPLRFKGSFALEGGFSLHRIFLSLRLGGGYEVLPEMRGGITFWKAGLRLTFPLTSSLELSLPLEGNFYQNRKAFQSGVAFTYRGGER